MKSKIFKYIVSFCAGTFLFTGCTKKFQDINTNTTVYTQSNFDPNYMLSSAQLTYTGSTDFAYDTWRSNLIYCSVMMQGFATTMGYWAGDKYSLNAGYATAYWDKAFPEQVKPVVDLIQSVKDKPQYKNLYQIGRIMKAMIMERITDLYGDIPYTGAGLGYYTGDFFPVYDKQQAIYTDLLKELDEASTALDATADKPSGDVFYNGNTDQWKRFANSLMLRVAMRLTKVDPTTAQAYATKVQGKTMIANTDNAAVKTDGTGSRTTNNRNSQILLGDGGTEYYYVKWSKPFIDMLKATNDPRLSKIAVTQLYLTNTSTVQNANYNASATVQKGMPNGRDLTLIAGQGITLDPTYTSFPDYSSPNPYMIKRDGNAFILTYAESELLLADAAQRWGIGGTASAVTHYNNGVKAGITYLSQYDAALAIPDATADAYIAANPYVAGNGLQMINNQMWVVCNTMLDFYESWCNWRRSDFPALTPVVFPNNVTNGTIPRRFPYPVSEASVNPANYTIAHNAVTGGDLLTGRVWWDK